MSIWMSLVGKKVFIRLNKGRVYSGIIKSVDTSSKPLIFISLIDKFNHSITILHSEILEIKEEN